MQKTFSLLFSYYSGVLHCNFTDRQKKSCNSVKTNAFQHFKYLFIVHNKNCSLINKICYFLEQYYNICVTWYLFFSCIRDKTFVVYNCCLACCAIWSVTLSMNVSEEPPVPIIKTIGFASCAPTLESGLFGNFGASVPDYTASRPGRHVQSHWCYHLRPRKISAFFNCVCVSKTDFFFFFTVRCYEWSHWCLTL